MLEPVADGGCELDGVALWHGAYPRTGGYAPLSYGRWCSGGREADQAETTGLGKSGVKAKGYFSN